MTDRHRNSHCLLFDSRSQSRGVFLFDHIGQCGWEDITEPLRLNLKLRAERWSSASVENVALTRTSLSGAKSPLKTNPTMLTQARSCISKDLLLVSATRRVCLASALVALASASVLVAISLVLSACFPA